MMQRSAFGRGNPVVNRVLFVCLGLEDFATTIKACGANVVTQVLLSRIRLDCRWGINQKVVRTVHTALGRGFFVLLNSHDNSCGMANCTPTVLVITTDPWF